MVFFKHTLFGLKIFKIKRINNCTQSSMNLKINKFGKVEIFINSRGTNGHFTTVPEGI